MPRSGVFYDYGQFVFRQRDSLIAAAFFISCALNAMPDKEIVLIGVIIFAVGAVSRMAILRQFGGRVFGKSDSDLITDGTFSVVRNPIYIANLIALVGSSLAIGGPIAASVMAIFGFFVSHICVLWEEQKLAILFPASYRSYLAQVPRWIPKMSAYAPPIGGGNRSWRVIFGIEKSAYLKLVKLLSLVFAVRFIFLPG